MDKKSELLKQFEKLRNNNVNLIAVSNSEWYSLFRDEIRNSIAIEGIFANRNELLDVLSKNKRTNDEKTAAIIGYFATQPFVCLSKGDVSDKYIAVVIYHSAYCTV